MLQVASVETLLALPATSAGKGCSRGTRIVSQVVSDATSTLNATYPQQAEKHKHMPAGVQHQHVSLKEAFFFKRAEPGPAATDGGHPANMWGDVGCHMCTGHTVLLVRVPA